MRPLQARRVAWCSSGGRPIVQGFESLTNEREGDIHGRVLSAFGQFLSTALTQRRLTKVNVSPRLLKSKHDGASSRNSATPSFLREPHRYTVRSLPSTAVLIWPPPNHTSAFLSLRIRSNREEQRQRARTMRWITNGPERKSTAEGFNCSEYASCWLGLHNLGESRSKACMVNGTE